MPDNPISSTPPFADFDAAAKGATFRRVDLHIHSFGVSKDVKDSSMVPAAIVAKAIERGIDMLAVTDHNAIDAVESAIAEGAKQGVTVIAGVELSTAEGHLLAYFDPSDLKGFKKWFGRLEFKEDGQDRVILAPMHQIVSDIDKAGGIAIPAHVARSKSGCLDIAPVKSLEELIESRAVAALEIDGPSEFNFFSNDDNSDGSSVRKAQLRKRIKALGEIDGTRLPKVYFSDAHELEQIGRNRDGDERLTRVKMSTPSFDALRQAILDPDARIRLEEQLPQTYPQIIGARMIGGFLDGQEIAFSPNLTCLIGGRGAGKSTALEAMRSACLSASHDRDASAGSGWPETVQLIYQDAFGELHYLERTSGSATIERVGSEAVPTSIEVEGYDQDSVAEIIRGYRDKPDLLGDFLDQFADLSSVQKLLSELRQEIEEHAEAIAPLADATQRKKTAQQALAEATAKLKVIETTKLKTALEYRRLLAKERTLRESMVDRLRKLSTDIDGLDTKVDVSTLLSAQILH